MGGAGGRGEGGGCMGCPGGGLVLAEAAALQFVLNIFRNIYIYIIWTMLELGKTFLVGPGHGKPVFTS